MIWNYKIIAKQNKITLIIIFYNSISYSGLASPACGTPIEENYSAHTDTSQDLTFKIFAGMKNWEKWDMCQTSGNRSNQFPRKRLKWFLKKQILFVSRQGVHYMYIFFMLFRFYDYILISQTNQSTYYIISTKNSWKFLLKSRFSESPKIWKKSPT